VLKRALINYLTKNTMEKRFNVFIVEDESNKAVALIGENLSEDRADRREDTAMGRIDTNNFTPYSVEVDSDEDKKYKNDLGK